MIIEGAFVPLQYIVLKPRTTFMLFFRDLRPKTVVVIRKSVLKRRPTRGRATERLEGVAQVSARQRQPRGWLVFLQQ